MKKVSFYTLGCRVNQYETQQMIQIFKNSGYEIGRFNEVCDVYVVNSCTVTAMSDKKSRQAARRAKRLNPDSVCAIVGCSPQKDSVNDAFSFADVVMGNGSKEKIVETVNEFLQSKTRQVCFNEMNNLRTYSEGSCIAEFENKTRAMIKIEDGCDRYCSYCIIPYVRGPVRSRNFENIIEEAKKLEENGFKEIVLTGIETAAYGQELKDKKLIDVVEETAKIKNIERIRIGSLEPVIITDDFVSRLKKTNKFCPSFHLSLQSGSDEVLKRMNRRYNTEEYEKSVETIRKYYPDAGITTDIIAGFPGETEEEFAQTENFVKKIGFSHVHIFPYSVREGTKAAEMKEKLTKREKESRVKRLAEVAEQSANDFINSVLGREYPVLFEKETEKNTYTGHTPNNLNVEIKSEKSLEGSIEKVILTKNNVKKE